MPNILLKRAGGEVATFLLFYSSVAFTVCGLKKVKFGLLHLLLQSFELTMHDSHTSLYSTKTLYHLNISDSFWQCAENADSFIYLN